MDLNFTLSPFRSIRRYQGGKAQKLEERCEGSLTQLHASAALTTVRVSGESGSLKEICFMRLGLNREVAISGLLCSTECALCVSHWDSIMLLVFVLRFSSSHSLSLSPNICHLKSLRRHNDIKGSAVRPPKSLLRGQTDTEINSQPLM